MKLMYKNRPVDVEIELGKHSACDSFIESGVYLDGAMEDLTISELDELDEMYSSEICDHDVQTHGYFRK